MLLCVMSEESECDYRLPATLKVGLVSHINRVEFSLLDGMIHSSLVIVVVALCVIEMCVLEGL